MLRRTNRPDVVLAVVVSCSAGGTLRCVSGFVAGSSGPAAARPTSRGDGVCHTDHVTAPLRRILPALLPVLFAVVLGAALGVLGPVGPVGPVGGLGPAAAAMSTPDGPTPSTSVPPLRAPRTSHAQDTKFFTDVAEADGALASYEQKQQNVALRALLTDGTAFCALFMRGARLQRGPGRRSDGCQGHGSTDTPSALGDDLQHHRERGAADALPGRAEVGPGRGPEQDPQSRKGSRPAPGLTRKQTFVEQSPVQQTAARQCLLINSGARASSRSVHREISRA